MLELSRIAQIAKAAKAFIAVVRDPRRTEAVFEMSNGVQDPRFLEPLAAHLRADVPALSALAQGPLIGKIDLDALGRLPAGTLGKVFSDHMRSLGLDPNFFPKVPVKTDFDYIRRHLYETHDVWHVVNGFNTEVAGELGLQAFYLAQFPAPLAFLVLSAGLLNTMLFHFQDRVTVFDEIVRGWQIGRAAKPFFAIDWTKLWAKPLREIRADLNVFGAVPIAAERVGVAPAPLTAIAN